MTTCQKQQLSEKDETNQSEITNWGLTGDILQINTQDQLKRPRRHEMYSRNVSRHYSRSKRKCKDQTAPDSDHLLCHSYLSFLPFFFWSLYVLGSGLKSDNLSCLYVPKSVFTIFTKIKNQNLRHRERSVWSLLVNLSLSPGVWYEHIVTDRAQSTIS